MTTNELRGKIQTVLGLIAPDALGRTLMHEHVLCDIRPPGTRADNDLGPEITLETVAQTPEVNARRILDNLIQRGFVRADARGSLPNEASCLAQGGIES